MRYAIIVENQEQIEELKKYVNNLGLLFKYRKLIIYVYDGKYDAWDVYREDYNKLNYFERHENIKVVTAEEYINLQKDEEWLEGDIIYKNVVFEHEI